MAKKCTSWQKEGSRRIYSKICETSRTRRNCRVAPAKLSGISGEDMWTVNCSVSAWNSRRGEWRLVPRGKTAVTKTIFAAKKAADTFLKK